VALDAAGVASGLHARDQGLIQSIDFSELPMPGMLSVLLFAGALHVDVKSLRDYRWQAGLLAFVGTAPSTIVVGVALWFVIGAIGLPVPLLECLLFGALISPTDPISLIGMLKSAGAPRNLEVVIAGESLFNDGVDVVIFTLLLDMALDGGGLLHGWAPGYATFWLLRSIDHYQVEVALTLAAVGGGYAPANHLRVSGPLAMVVAGLIVGSNARLPAGAAGVLTWGSLPGGISIALALSIPAGPRREMLIALTYGVVAFSIPVRGLTFGRPVRVTVRTDA
jgi:CPA1 family monovalent cation:H+ antiporter